MYQETSAPVPNPPQGMAAFGDWFSEVFRLWGAQWGVWVLQGLIVFALCVVPAIAGYLSWYIPFMMQVMAHPSANPPIDPISMVRLMGITYSLMALGGLIFQFLLPGMIITALKQLRGEAISVGDLFSGLRYGGVAFLISLLTGLGVLGCFFGVYMLMGMLSLALPLLIDRRLSLGRAISLSWAATTKNFWLYVLFFFVIGLLVNMGTLACYIGVIATFAFLPLAQAVAYARTFGGVPDAMPNLTAGVVPPPYTPGGIAPAQATGQCILCGAKLAEGETACPQCGQVQ
ncbi:MAG TPA: hypothetical protein VGL77_09750 [Armatimonadota bacterium]|jgi:hypothetical protein